LDLAVVAMQWLVGSRIRIPDPGCAVKGDLRPHGFLGLVVIVNVGAERVSDDFADPPDVVRFRPVWQPIRQQERGSGEHLGTGRNNPGIAHGEVPSEENVWWWW